MMKTLYLTPASLLLGVLVSGCVTTSPENYAAQDCDSLRTLVSTQDYTASVRGVQFKNDRGVEEFRLDPVSPRAGKTHIPDEKNLRDERQTVRKAYRQKGCKA